MSVYLAKQYDYRLAKVTPGRLDRNKEWTYERHTCGPTFPVALTVVRADRDKISKNGKSFGMRRDMVRRCLVSDQIKQTENARLDRLQRESAIPAPRHAVPGRRR
jgi:hypothetical protein